MEIPNPQVSPEGSGEISERSTGEQRIMRFVFRELTHLRWIIANMDKRLISVEERQPEVLDELHRIWETDPETGGSKSHE